MPTWDERFRSGSYPQDPAPSRMLERHVASVPPGRALDVATGTGRNATFLAAEGYEVDAVDKSREGLEITRGNAADRGAADRVNPIRADLTAYGFPTGVYDLVTVSFYRAIDRFPDLVGALAPGGVLFVEHRLRTTASTDSGPASDRYRFAANELLRACLGLTVLSYEEGIERRPDGRTTATARILARNTTGTKQSYPTPPRTGTGGAGPHERD